MKILLQHLRDTSARYGGIPHYLKAASDLDVALSAFFKEQSIETLQALNGAVACCERYRQESVRDRNQIG